MFFKYLIFFSFGLIISFIDMDMKIIPDILSLPLIGLGLIFSLLHTDISFAESISGAFLAFSVFVVIAVICQKILKKDCLGGGDIKLIGAIGSFLGIFGALMSIFFGSVIALLFLFIFQNKMKKEFPFGQFLILGSFIYLFFGNTLIEMYLSLWHL